MRPLSARILAALAAAWLAATAALPAAAHPHAWIDVLSSVRFDDEGRVTAIVEEWLFDPYYSAFITDGLPKDAAKRQPELEALARTNLANLREYDYFTDIRVGEARIEVAKVEHYETTMHKGRLWMRFTLPLAEPVDVRGRFFAYAIYDPSYYAEMLHVEGMDIGLAPPAGLACTARLTPPSPTAETKRLAAALDKTQSAGDSLGIHFAEWARIECE